MKTRNLNNLTFEFLTSDLTLINEVAYFDYCVSAGFPLPVNDFQELKISFDKVKFSGQDLKRKWKMKQECLSPCYSTNLKDIITVNSK